VLWRDLLELIQGDSPVNMVFKPKLCAVFWHPFRYMYG